MKVLINQRWFEHSTWTAYSGEGVLRFATDENIGEIATRFYVANTIEVYSDQDELISKLYDVKFTSISLEGEEYIARFQISLIDENTKEQLQSGMSDAENAIMELAEMCAALEGVQQEAEEYLKQYRERVEDVIKQADNHANQMDEKYEQHVKLINRLDEMVSKIRNAVTAAEDAISGMPKNVNERIGIIEETYNKLADRVARLENGMITIQNPPVLS